MPLSRTRAVLDRVAAHVREVQQSIDAPFLLENNVYFVEMPDDEMDEAGFLNAVCHESGCGLVLDLHNFTAIA
jgi:uncharacterized protein (UPF0276 family)